MKEKKGEDGEEVQALHGLLQSTKVFHYRKTSLSFLMPSKLKEVSFLKRSLEALYDCCTKLIMSRLIWARELRRKIIEVGVNCLCFLSQAPIASGWWILELHQKWNCSFCRSEFSSLTFVCETICHSFFWFICLSFILLWTVLADANCNLNL